MCIFLGQGQYDDRCITETAQVHMIWVLFKPGARRPQAGVRLVS